MEPRAAPRAGPRARGQRGRYPTVTHRQVLRGEDQTEARTDPWAGSGLARGRGRGVKATVERGRSRRAWDQHIPGRQEVETVETANSLRSFTVKVGKELDACGSSSLGRCQPLSHASPKVCTGSGTTEFVSWSREVPDGVAPLQRRLRARAFRPVALRVRRGPRSCARVHQPREGREASVPTAEARRSAEAPPGGGRREHSSRLSPGGARVLQGVP